MSHVSFARAFMFLKVGFGGSPADFRIFFLWKLSLFIHLINIYGWIFCRQSHILALSGGFGAFP